MILTADGISKKFYRRKDKKQFIEVVKTTSLQVCGGKITTVTGRSGSGKSTLLYMLAGLLSPSTGQVLSEKGNLYTMNDRTLSRFRNKNMGIIPQGQTGLFALSVLENVKVQAALYGSSDGIDERAYLLLEKLGIAHLADARIPELSGGELRRMAVARALVTKPAIILADEPTDDLDEENTVHVLELLRQTADEGCAVFLVTHEQKAKAVSDSVFTMENGNLTHSTIP